MQIDPCLPNSLKYRRLAQALKPQDPLGHLVRLWLWCQHKGTRELSISWKVGLIETTAYWSGEPGKFYKACIECGFIEETATSIVICDFPTNPRGGHWKVTLPEL